VALHAREKLLAKSADLIVANDVSRSDVGFDVDENEIVLLDRWGGTVALPRQPKTTVADRILDRVVTRRASVPAAHGDWVARRGASPPYPITRHGSSQSARGRAALKGRRRRSRPKGRKAVRARRGRRPIVSAGVEARQPLAATASRRPPPSQRG